MPSEFRWNIFLKIALGWVMSLKMAQNALFPYFSELFLVLLLKHSSKQYSTEFHNGSWFKRGNGNRNSKAKNNPWKFHIIFSWSPLEIPLHFLINPWKFCMLFLWYLKEIPYAPILPPVWIFSGITQQLSQQCVVS